MNLIFSDQAREDYLHWQEVDRKTLRRIHELLKDIKRNPHTGTGRPEPLRHALAGCGHAAWTRNTA